MNTNALKKFAQNARRQLLLQVAAKLDYVLTSDTAELRERAAQVQALRKALESSTREQLVEKVAYTWFNRLMALRFMDANDYQPGGLRVVSPREGYSLPQLLEEAKQGNFPPELAQEKQTVLDLLDGRLPSNNPQNEAYRHLLIAACNALHQQFPFLFERINDYTELLLPDDLTSEFSIVHAVVAGMSTEDCQEVEVIGWLYQFYISEKNEELIKSKKIYKKEELAPASQLFTPKWIVQYMVDNTLGQLWSEIRPDTKVLKKLAFYIEPANRDQLPKREYKSVEDIKFFDPCVGSGHILSYAFDVFYHIYEEEGYAPSEIPALIISKNLWGIDIDSRAAQMAAFVLLMKARGKYRRFFRVIDKGELELNVSFYQNFPEDDKFNKATTLGSLINIDPDEVDKITIDSNSIFAEQQKHLGKLYRLLGQQYEIVVTNPPYISSNRMEVDLKEFIQANYAETKSDLFATFIIRCLELCTHDGFTGYMTPFLWMFITSYKKLRVKILNDFTISSLVQLEYSGFDGATVPICTFILRKSKPNLFKGSYIRLSDFKGSYLQGPKTIEAIQNPDCDWIYTIGQEGFKRIPGSPIGYWLKDSSLNIIFNEKRNKSFKPALNGLQTGDTLRFIRSWFEVKHDSFNQKWFAYNKGGSFRKWYGNINQLINWKDSGKELKDWKKEKLRKGEITANNSKCWNETSYMKTGVTWTDGAQLRFVPSFLT